MRTSRRKLLPPESLEPRNAPSSSLPLLADLFALDAGVDARGGSESMGAAESGLASGEAQSSKSAGGPADTALELIQLGIQNLQSRARTSETASVSGDSTPATSVASGDYYFSSLGLAPLERPLTAQLVTLDDQPTSRDDQPAPSPVVTATPPPAAVRSSSGGGGAAVSKIGGGASGSGSKSPLATRVATSAAATTTPAAPSVQPVTPTQPATEAQPAAKTNSTSTSTTTAASTPANATTTSKSASASSPSLAGSATQAAKKTAALSVATSDVVITADDVKLLLERAAAATARNDAIIAIVDREGQILGVRVEEGVSITDQAKRVFAIDGAVAKARTAAFFSSDSAPLTSRTVRFISQSTITQREVESNPNIDDKASTIRGPGFVAPIGLGGHFPPGVMLTPQVDLFAIEHTNRDSLDHPGRDGVKGTNDDVELDARFGADFIEGQEVLAPESYGTISGMLPDAQSRGIATLPGGAPLYKVDATSSNGRRLVGGIGVFFPGPEGYATFEQNFQHSYDRWTVGMAPQTAQDRVNAPLVLEAEFTAAAVAANIDIPGVPRADGYVLELERIDLAGITLETVGPHPKGLKGLLAFGKTLGVGDPDNGENMRLTTDMDNPVLTRDGAKPPDGWLVMPRAASDGSITAAEVQKIIEDGVAEANRVRAQIRELGNRTRMVLSVTDKEGNILGLFRMQDATVFSIDVAVAKARNVAYYADPQDVERVDLVDSNFDGNPEVAAGAAFTNRTFRYLSTPFFPTGVDGQPSGPFSTLNEPGINPLTAENVGAPKPANQFNTVLGYDAFNPGTNFRELNDPNAVAGNQNGVVFFPGSTPLYKNGKLVGGLGVSGDGVDQDDVVTFGAAGNYLPSLSLPIQRADEVFVRNVRLPFIKFSRNPHA